MSPKLDGIVDASITLFKPIAVSCGTDSFLYHISHIQVECEEYSVELCRILSICGIFRGILSVPQNTAMGLNNVMRFLRIPMYVAFFHNKERFHHQSCCCTEPNISKPLVLTKLHKCFESDGFRTCQ
jgi:hypothetical protein